MLALTLRGRDYERLGAIPAIGMTGRALGGRKPARMQYFELHGSDLVDNRGRPQWRLMRHLVACLPMIAAARRNSPDSLESIASANDECPPAPVGAASR